MNPYQSNEVQRVVREYFDRFYADDKPRTLLLGINPGRFGAGITGLSFTDPVILKEQLGIDHSFDMRPELSSRFIHEVIDEYGGLEFFSRQFFITSVYPLGFIKDGKNVNYYEIPGWKQSLRHELVKELTTHRGWNINRKVGICIGKGDNLKHLTALNDELGLFEKIVTVPHPRWVMQYNLRSKLKYVDDYLKVLSAV